MKNQMGQNTLKALSSYKQSGLSKQKQMAYLEANPQTSNALRSCLLQYMVYTGVGIQKCNLLPQKFCYIKK